MTVCRRARLSTISSAASNAMVSGRQSGRICMLSCARPWVARQAQPLQRWTVSRSSRQKKGGYDRGVGYDAGKKVKGRKIHALVDTEGLPLRVIVHSAGIQDRDGAILVIER